MDDDEEHNLSSATRQPPGPSLSSHPRRPPAHKSVSLLHGSRTQEAPPVSEAHDLAPKVQKQWSTSDNRADLRLSLSSLPPQPEKFSSSGESSNADKWFENSNNNVRSASADVMDNDPPFFLRNSSSSETSPDAAQRERANATAPDSLPHRTGLLHLGTTASSSEDFRSVIDDLTVQNRKLKRKLKKYEKLHDAHLQAEKLFEIRVHSLPSHKKRELEETLRKFAAGLQGDIAKTNSSGPSSAQLGSVPPHIEQQITGASSLGVLDSAYASASGQFSSGQSGSGSNSVLRRPSSKAGMSSAQQRDIQTYLSDIPQGLLPKPVAMTEKSKKKLIVRRLEQIFAGKGASKSGHQQPIQQEEISQSAARADRTEREASGKIASKEGSREARIMGPKRRQSGGVAGTEVEMQDVTPPEPPALNVSNVDFAIKKPKGEKSPDQRPTRPLDLDPNRAQVPEDNIRYLRHLGFSPLEVDSDEYLVDGHGYMYLNVLINMAQLHTLNVTPEFVKKSIEQYSKKLELSSDGRKVRWKGGHDFTRNSSNGSPDDGSNTSGQPGSGLDGRKKMLLASTSGDGSSESFSKSGKTPKDPENKLAYVPLFFHQGDGDEDESDSLSDWSSPDPELAAVESSGLTSSGIRTNSSKKRQANDGPIIFYNKAPFITDLSGDWRGANVKSVNVQDYSAFPIHAVGIPPTRAQLRRMESKGPLSKQEIAIDSSPEAMDVDSVMASESVHGFSKPPSMKTVGSSSDDNTDLIEFEASGIGGVYPSDNFSLNIKSRHSLASGGNSASRSNAYPPRIRAILAERGLAASAASSSNAAAQADPQTAQILTNKRKDLPPSELPPPSYFPLSSPDGDDDYSDDDEESEMDDAPLLYSDQPLRRAARQAFKWPSTQADTATEGDDNEEGDDDDDDAEKDAECDDDSNDKNGTSDESVDMLMHARIANPELIRVAEREYDSTLAERLAEDILAGSSAATAGGGSGFNSPVSPLVDGDAGSTRTRHTQSGKSPDSSRAHPQRGILKRARTSGDGKQQQQARASKSPKMDRTSPTS